MRRYGKNGTHSSETKLVCPDHTMDFAPRIGRLPVRTQWKRVIVESPFGSSDAGEVEKNLTYLRAVMRACLLHGEAPFASHALYSQPGVLKYSNPVERNIGILAGLEWGQAADKTVVYTDRGFSDDMRIGMARAERQQRKIEIRKLKEYKP